MTSKSENGKFVLILDPYDDILTSRSDKWLFTQFKSLQNINSSKYHVDLYDSDDLRRWKVMLKGPDGTPYEKGFYHLMLTFTTLCPFEAPEIVFCTPIFHPNIRRNGAVCLNNLEFEWKTSRSIQRLLHEIVQLLENPNFDDFIFEEAAFLFVKNRDEFRKTAQEWTRKFASNKTGPDTAVTLSLEHVRKF